MKSLTKLAVSGLLLGASGVAGAARPAADFAALPFIQNPVLSPDGTKVAARVAVNGVQNFAILDLVTNGAKPVVIGLNGNDLTDWRWVGDQWLGVGLGRVVSFSGQPVYVSRVAGISADGKTITPIDFNSPGQWARIAWAANDGTPRVIIVARHSIYLDTRALFWPDAQMFDLSTGRGTRIVQGRDGVSTWIADPAGTIRAGIGYDGTSALLLYRDTPDQTFRVRDKAKVRDDTDRLTVPIFLAGGASAAFAATDGFESLYELKLSDLSLGKKLYGVPGYDIDYAWTAPGDGRLLGIGYTSDRAHVAWIDPAMAAVQADLDKAVGGNARIISLSRDTQRMIVQVAAPGTAGAYYLYDAKAGAMSRFGYVNATLKQTMLGPVSMIRYKARDGREIEAVLTLPPGREAKNLPLILLPHGGPRARDSMEYDWWVQFLADRGYAVIQPNYRGSSGYGDALEKAGEGEWGLKMQDDLNDAVDHLAKKGIADPGRVCVAGGSYGGYAAMRGAERDGKRYRCAISYAGVSDLGAMVRYDRNFLGGDDTARFLKKQAPDFSAVSPINDPQGFATPILIMHGKKDLRVPVDQSRRMAAKLRAAGKPVDYIEQPEGDHFFSRQADRLQFLEAMEAFLAKHNPA